MVLSVIACNQVTSEPEVVQLALTAKGFDEVIPLEGVEICQLDTTNCATTNAAGNATLELPAGEKVAWTTVREGYGSYLVADVTDADFAPTSAFAMGSNEWLAKQFGLVLSDYPPRSTGAVLVALVPPFAGATVTLVDATGKRFYIDEEGNSALGLEATTSDGTAGFVEVGPGEFQVEIGGTAQRCVPARAWPSDEDNRIEVPVREGYITAAAVNCALP